MRKKKPHLFVILGILMILVGAYAMLSCVIGGRLNAEQSQLLLFGFTTVAVGSMLLTRSAISVFFFFLYTGAIAAIQISQSSIISTTGIVSLALFGVGILLVKSLPKK